MIRDLLVHLAEFNFGAATMVAFALVAFLAGRGMTVNYQPEKINNNAYLALAVGCIAIIAPALRYYASPFEENPWFFYGFIAGFLPALIATLGGQLAAFNDSSPELLRLLTWSKAE